MEKIEQKLPLPEPIQPAMNTVSITSIITKELGKINALLETKPKSITREFRVLLFPENNAIEYSRIVFGRLIFWMTIVLIYTYFFAPGKEYIVEDARVKEVQSEASLYRKAWNNLYKNSKKATRQKMDTTWIKVINDYK